MNDGLTAIIMKKIEDISVDEALRALIADTDLVEVVCCLDMIAREDDGRVELHDPTGTVYPAKVTVTHVIDAVPMMRELIERGYTYDAKGVWVLECEVSFVAWHMCGHKFENEPPNSNWPEWMLEQREV